jgi:hypothetical protein
MTNRARAQGVFNRLAGRADVWTVSPLLAERLIVDEIAAELDAHDRRQAPRMSVDVVLAQLDAAVPTSRTCLRWDNENLEWIVICPACGHEEACGEYSHIRQAGTLMGIDDGEATVYRGTRVLGVAEGERRSGLSIVFDGECEHAWEMRVQQHKGVNTMTVRLLPGGSQLHRGAP